MKNDLIEKINIDKLEFVKYLDYNEIKSIISDLAERINDDYKDKDTLFIVVLRGAAFFATRLIQELDISCQIEFIFSKSYYESMISSKEPVISEFNFELKDRDIIIIEDIIDSGHTLFALIQKITDYSPSSVEVVTLLSKPESREVIVDVKYIGREVPSDYVIGFGFDYREKYRHLKSIYKLSGKK